MYAFASIICEASFLFTHLVPQPSWQAADSCGGQHVTALAASGTSRFQLDQQQLHGFVRQWLEKIQSFVASQETEQQGYATQQQKAAYHPVEDKPCGVSHKHRTGAPLKEQSPQNSDHPERGSRVLAFSYRSRLAFSTPSYQTTPLAFPAPAQPSTTSPSASSLSSPTTQSRPPASSSR